MLPGDSHRYRTRIWELRNVPGIPCFEPNHYCASYVGRNRKSPKDETRPGADWLNARKGVVIADSIDDNGA
jgi:hypothetical protein